MGQHPAWIAIKVTAAALPAVGLLIWLSIGNGRTSGALAVADACVKWTHQDPATRQALPPETARSCDQYFRFRSEAEADEDEARWRAAVVRP